MPYAISQRVWAALPAQQQQNEADGYVRWFNARNDPGGMSYTFPGPEDHSGTRDAMIIDAFNLNVPPASTAQPDKTVDWTDWRSWADPNEPDDPFPTWLLFTAAAFTAYAIFRKN